MILLVIFLYSFSDPSFSIKNLKYIPVYERYEFKAEGTDLKESHVIIEYRLKYENTDSAVWKIKGSMPINKTRIEEDYEIRLKDLNVLESKRKQYFDRGTSESLYRYKINNRSTKKNEFVISTLQGLMYILRTFPIDNTHREIIVRIAQQSNKKIGIKIKNRGLTKLNIPQRGEIPAYNIDVSLAVPIVGAFLPKVNYYFLDDEVHTLVAMKGAFSMTGKKLDVLLVNYESEI
jgi:hypothetical protein